MLCSLFSVEVSYGAFLPDYLVSIKGRFDVSEPDTNLVYVLYYSPANSFDMQT